MKQMYKDAEKYLGTGSETDVPNISNIRFYNECAKKYGLENWKKTILQIRFENSVLKSKVVLK